MSGSLCACRWISCLGHGFAPIYQDPHVGATSRTVADPPAMPRVQSSRVLKVQISLESSSTTFPSVSCAFKPVTFARNVWLRFLYIAPLSRDFIVLPIVLYSLTIAQAAQKLLFHHSHKTISLLSLGLQLSSISRTLEYPLQVFTLLHGNITKYDILSGWPDT